jgi:hypothetical protein
MTDCAFKECFTTAVPRSQWCSNHSLQVQRVRGYMAEAEGEMTSKPTHTPTDSRIFILSTLRDWLARARR